MVRSTDKGWIGAGGELYATAADARESFAKKFHWPTPVVSERDRVEERRLRVFLSHAKEDKAVVRQLNERLAAGNMDPWFDELKLLAGQKWREEISKAIRATDAFLACLSQVAVSKVGYVNREFREALDVADQQPEGKIFIIPVRLDACRVPDRFADIQRVDYFEADGFARLLISLKALADWLQNSGAKVAMPT